MLFNGVAAETEVEFDQAQDVVCSTAPVLTSSSTDGCNLLLEQPECDITSAASQSEVHSTDDCSDTAWLAA